MTLSVWAFAGIVLLTALIAGGAAFLVGRRTAADSKRIAALESELATQRSALEAVNTGINAHFEESAKLFGQLAQDYRAFFEHFTSTASTLGLSERRTEALRVAVETELLPKDANLGEDNVAEVSLEQKTDGEAAAEASDREPAKQAAG